MGSRLEKNSNAVSKRIQSHAFSNEEGEEYEPSKFGGFSEYFRRKKIKLQNRDAQIRSDGVENPHIFRGVVAHVNGYTQPSLNDLHRLIVSHGGGFMQYLDGKTTVTHIICSNLTPKKAVEFKRYRIVKPAWVVESVKAGRLLPWDEFRVLTEGAGQRVLGFDNGKVVSQADKKARGYHEEIEGSWYTEQLKKDEPSSSARLAFLSQKIANNQPTPDVDDEITDEPSSPTPPDEVDNSNAAQDDGLLASRKSSPAPDGPLASPKAEAEVDAERTMGMDGTPEHLAEIADATFGSIEAFEVQELADKSVETDAAAGQYDDATRRGWTLDTIEEYAKNQEAREDAEHAQNVKRALDEGAEPPAKRPKLTAEEHNAILLADPNVRKSTVVDPNFLEQYYRESRLHHLSTWKAELKAQMQALATEKSGTQKQRKKKPQGARRYVLHVDFDSFFAAVSLKKHPQYQDKPAVVAHGQGSGSEIASCNYPARAFGVKNGMWMRRALELCPDLKIMPYDFPAYEEASREFYEAIIASGGVVQSVSIDEALVDVTDQCLAESGSDGIKRYEGAVDREQWRADKIAENLRAEVKEKTGCNVSVGIGGNILLAKVALRRAKPAGQHHIKPEEILEFIGKLEVQDLPGVAYSLGGKLEELGIKFVRDIREVTKEKLVNSLGPKTGEKLWEYARGIDKAEVGDVVVRKSVSAEVNWGVRFENQEQVDEFIDSLAGEVMKRLLKERVKGKQLTMKVMRRAPDAPLDPPKHLGHGKCDTYNKSAQLGVATNSQPVIFKEAISMLNSFGFSPGELRGLGIQMTKLEPMKTGSDGQTVSSQPRLLFKPAPAAKSRLREVSSPPPTPALAPISRRDAADPIEDVVTPKKQQKHPDDEDVGFGADQLAVSTPSRKPLNTTGTQFVLPTQVDPSVLAELPADIRAKLAGHVDLDRLMSKAKPRKSGSTQLGLPNQSQLDPEIFKALPEDVQDEIISFYANQTKTSLSFRKRHDQAVLPQSPRSNRTIAVTKKPIPAPALLRKRGRPPKSVGQAASKLNSTLTQANFTAAGGRLARAGSHDVYTSGTDSESKGKAGEIDDEEVSAEFLAALPEDIRAEVLAQQRASRLKKKSGFDLAVTRKKRPPAQRAAGGDDEVPASIQRLLKLPPKPQRPTFTSRKLSSLEDLRKAMSAWYAEFRDEGPYEEDINALVVYFGRVVSEEKDIAKVSATVRWLVWVVEDGQDELAGTAIPEGSQQKWSSAVEVVKKGVQGAVQSRGLAALDL